MNKIALLILGLLSGVLCFAQEDTRGIGFGLELYVFDQSKVATDIAPSIYDDKVLQLNYSPQLTYTFARTSTIGLFAGFGKRNIDYTTDGTVPVYDKTETYQFGLFYKYKFLYVKRFGAYCQSSWQFQEITQKRTYYSLSNEITYGNYLYREIYSFDMNFKLGIEYRIVAGLYINTYIGNDLIAYESITSDVEINSAIYSEQTVNYYDFDGISTISAKEYTYRGQWILFKNYIIFGAGLRYQF